MRKLYKNWSALIPLSVFVGDKLKLEESSFLTNAPSLFTYIKKTRSSIMAGEVAIDINLMSPMIIKNCLPFPVELKFTDSSGVHHRVCLEKEEEKMLECFNMAQSIPVDITIQEFQPVKGFKLLNLEEKLYEDQIQLEDRYGRKTMIYT